MCGGSLAPARRRGAQCAEPDSGSSGSERESADRRRKQRLVAASRQLVANQIATAIGSDGSPRDWVKLQGEHKPGGPAAAVAGAFTGRTGLAGIRRHRRGMLRLVVRRGAAGRLGIIGAAGAATGRRVAAVWHRPPGACSERHRRQQQSRGQRGDQANSSDRGHQLNNRAVQGSESRGEPRRMGAPARCAPVIGS
jgi:hypothetical protein